MISVLSHLIVACDSPCRISATEALAHPFILHDYPEDPLDEDIYKDDQYENED